MSAELHAIVLELLAYEQPFISILTFIKTQYHDPLRTAKIISDAQFTELFTGFDDL
jgi:hypothetical protein